MSAAHIADEFIFFLQAQTALIHLGATLCSIQRHVQSLCFGETGKGGSGTHRVAGIGVAMTDRGLAGFIMFKQLGDLLGHHHRAERKIAIGDGLGRAGKIGLYPPVTRPGPGTGPSESCDNLISDQQNAVVVADVTHHRHEAFMWRDHPAGTKDRLHDKGGDGIWPLKGNFINQGRCAELGKARRIRLVKRVAIGIRGRDVITAGKQRFVLGPEFGISIDAGTAHMRAVIPFFQADEFYAPGIATNFVILAGKAQSGLDTVAAARGIESALQTIRFKKLRQFI